MTVFEALLLGHILGDWLLQTEWQAINKERSWLALSVHVAIYHLIVFAILYWGYNYQLQDTAVTVLILAVLHAALDRRASVLWLMRALRITVERKPERWLMVAIDQGLHVLLLGAAVVALNYVSAL